MRSPFGRCPALLVLFLVQSSGVSAQVYRTFVSGTGNDANPCSVTSPCRNFQRAHDVVEDDGEIVALDSAGYGSLVVTKSISISAPDGVYAGITSTGDAVTVNTAGVNVYLRGLTIVYAGLPATTSHGVKFSNGASVFLDRCRIKEFDYGLSVEAAGKAIVRNSVISGSTAAGLYSAHSDARVSVIGCVLQGNEIGIASALGAWAVVNSIVNGGGIGISNYAVGQEMVVSGTTMTKNTTGVSATASSKIRMVNCLVTGNDQGLLTATMGQIFSRSPLSNTVEKNITADGTFSGTYAAK